MRKIKILIVEDESIVALDIKKTLEKFDYEVTSTAVNSNEAVNSVISNRPDLILMDVNLGKGKDGIDTVKEIKILCDVPIIYLTAFSDEETINRAIETKPVSYLIKPFKQDDLKSNIMLGLYKTKILNDKPTNQKFVYLGDNYYFFKDKNELYYNSLSINLGRKEKLLLRMLVDSKGQIVRFEDIENIIWGSRIISDSTLRTLIYRLRAKLEYKIIETISNIGCKIS